MLGQLYNLLIILLMALISSPILACAVCYADNGMSGASIALIVIVSSFLILFITYRVLKRALNKDWYLLLSNFNFCITDKCIWRYC